MKQFRFLLIASFFIINFSEIKATHTAACEIYYQWSHDSTYQITLVFFRNCTGPTAGAPFTTSVSVSSASLGYSSTINLAQLSPSGPYAPPIQPPNIYNCVSGSYCTQEYVYRSNWTSPGKANDWKFSYSICCLPTNLAPANVQNSAIYAETGLNNLNFPDTVYKNDAPLFHNRRPNHPNFPGDTVNNPAWRSVCAFRNVQLSQKVRNYDNDIIKYELFQPLTSGGSPVSYNTGYSLTNPMPTQSGITFDSITGMLSFIPSNPVSTGIYLLGVRATAFQYDTVLVGGNPVVSLVKKGYVNRNLFIFVEDSSNCPDNDFAFKDTASTSSVTSMDLKCNENPFRIEFKRRVMCSSIDTNGSFILIIDSITGDTIDIKRVYSNDCANNLTTNGISVVTDSVLGPGSYILTFIKGSDGDVMLTECFGEIPPYKDSLTINVTAAPPLGVLIGDTGSINPYIIEVACRESQFSVWLTESFLCNSLKANGSDFSLLDISSMPYSSINLSNANTTGNCFGGQSSKVQVKTSQPLDPGTYLLSLVKGTDQNRLVNSCFQEFDSSSIVISVADVSIDLGPDIFYCRNAGWDTILYDTSGFAIYYWSTGGFGDSLQIDTAGVYWVQAQTNTGCSASDTVMVIEKECFIGIAKEEYPSMRVYPNPTRDQITIESDNLSSGMRFTIIDIHGHVLITKNLTKPLETLSIDHLESGSYIVEISKGNQVYSSVKIVKQ